MVAEEAINDVIPVDPLPQPHAAGLLYARGDNVNPNQLATPAARGPASRCAITGRRSTHPPGREQGELLFSLAWRHSTGVGWIPTAARNRRSISGRRKRRSN